MARNEEKHYGKLNRLYLLKEKEEYEKANPKRPRLDTLHTPEEIQKWIPSIKKDIEFYLKKSQVTCYSDAHVEDCQGRVVKLEKEFKAFVRKMRQLSSSPLEAIPWTSRPYKRKKLNDSEESSSKDFKRIATPILDEQKESSTKTPLFLGINLDIMDQPLNFSTNSGISEEKDVHSKNISSLCTANSGISQVHSKNISSLCVTNSNVKKCVQHPSETRTIQRKSLNYCDERYDEEIDNQFKLSIVNYDSSDSEGS